MTDPPVIDDSGPEPVYRQVADHITAKITSGELQPGAKLPAERDLATEYGVAYLTVRRAMRLLRERGLVITSIGRGNYIARPEQRN